LGASEINSSRPPVRRGSVTVQTRADILLEKESSNLKKNIAFRLCFATAVFVATTMLSAQQATPSPASGKNMTEEQVNDAKHPTDAPGRTL
jgi:hypothetical protein